MKARVLNVPIWSLVMMGAMLSTGAWATDSDDAKAGCERVDALRVAELQRNGQKAPAVDCQYNSRSPAYWQCMEETMASGNPWLYAMEQCKKE